VVEHEQQYSLKNKSIRTGALHRYETAILRLPDRWQSSCKKPTIHHVVCAVSESTEVMKT
jgi:hypothetical protein